MTGTIRTWLLAAILAGGFGAAEAAAKTLTIGVEVEPQGFDAVKGRVLGEAPASVALTVFDKLVEWGPNREILPMLAESWTESDDGKTFTFKLRQDVKFHDGAPFNADAVVAHFTRILDPKSKYVGLLFIRPIQSVEKVDDYTVRFNLAHKWLPMLGTLAANSFNGFIPSPKAVADDTMNRAPVATGPYMFKEWKGGDKIVLVRNPDYWNKNAKIHFDEIVFRLLPDQQTRFAAVQSGEIDATWTDRGESIVQARDDKSLAVHSLEGAGGSIIFLNNSKPPLDNVHVRRALSLVWDQKYYVESQLQNTQRVTHSGLEDDAKCDSAYLPDGDVAAAKKELAAFGNPVAVELTHTATQRGRELGLLFQQLGKRAGMTMTLKPLDQLSFVQTVFKNDYQIAGWRIADTGDIGSQIFALLHSKSPYNLAHYSDPEMDKLLVAMRTAATPEARFETACAVARKMNQDAPILWNNGRTHNVIAKKALKGIGPLYMGTLDVRFAWFEN